MSFLFGSWLLSFVHPGGDNNVFLRRFGFVFLPRTRFKEAGLESKSCRARTLTLQTGTSAYTVLISYVRGMSGCNAEVVGALWVWVFGETFRIGVFSVRFSVFTVPMAEHEFPYGVAKRAQTSPVGSWHLVHIPRAAKSFVLMLKRKLVYSCTFCRKILAQ